MKLRRQVVSSDCDGVLSASGLAGVPGPGLSAPGPGLGQSSEPALPGADGIEEHLEGEDSAVKDLEDVEVKDLVDLNLNLDPEDGKEAHTCFCFCMIWKEMSRYNILYHLCCTVFLTILLSWVPSFKTLLLLIVLLIGLLLLLIVLY